MYPGRGDLVTVSNDDGRRRPRWLRLVTLLVVTVVVAAVAFSGYWAVRLVTNVDYLALGAGGSRSGAGTDDRTDRLQILVLGSDTRSGANSEYGTEEDSTGYGQSDVLMLVDISADNSDVNVLSFPRDLLVDIPRCTDQQSGVTYDPRPGAMVNSAMRDAGPGCAVDTINRVTGLEIDHFMLADFNAVTELSDAVGGVEVCVSEAVDEPKSGLKLPAGTSSVQGEQALAFLRARAAFGDGGDLGRIQAQQAFLGSLTRKIKDEGTLRNPQRILGIADALTSNLTVDKGLASVPAMVTIADRLKDIDPSHVSFISVPTVPAADPNRLVLDEPIASELFSVLQQGSDLSTPAPESAPEQTPEPSEAPSAEAGVSYTPVTVADGTGGAAVVGTVVELLTDGGYAAVQEVPAAGTPLTGVYYSAGFEDDAAAVASALGLRAAAAVQDDTIYGVRVYVGGDARDGLDALTATPDVQGTVNQTADQVSCQDTNPFG
ncbi:transcriptional regulator [Arthrobacter sp. RIT-PI-e]|nr:transcriptional regulator [Arthrobacter sp. RIT-PI-e]